jgi:hypothetical protein
VIANRREDLAGLELHHPEFVADLLDLRGVLHCGEDDYGNRRASKLKRTHGFGIYEVSLLGTKAIGAKRSTNQASADAACFRSCLYSAKESQLISRSLLDFASTWPMQTLVIV